MRTKVKGERCQSSLKGFPSIPGGATTLPLSNGKRVWETVSTGATVVPSNTEAVVDNTGRRGRM